MGKVRRARQKFHQSPAKSNEQTSGSTDSGYQLIGKSPLLKSPEEFTLIPDNLFEGIDIDFDNLKKKIEEDDKISVRSLAKSCKYDSQGKLLTKMERMKLRRDLLMRKLNTLEESKKIAHKKHKNRKSLMKSSVPPDYRINCSPLLKNPNSENIVHSTQPDEFPRKERKVKVKGIKKSKVRQREMLQEISAFRKILSDPKFMKDPTSTITESVQQKIRLLHGL